MKMKEKAIRIARKRNEALVEDMIETNEFEDRNAKSEEEYPFSSGFGELHSDTDEASDVDSNDKEQTIVANENAKMQPEDYDTKQETSDTTGRSIF